MDTISSLDRYLALAVRHRAHGASSLDEKSPVSDDLDRAAANLSPEGLEQARRLLGSVFVPAKIDSLLSTGHEGLDELLATTARLTRSESFEATIAWASALGDVLADLPMSSTPDPSMMLLDRVLEDAPATPDSGDVGIRTQAEGVSLAVMGAAFRQVLVDPQVKWRKNDSSDFVPCVIQALARESEINPSDATMGRIFLEVLKAPDRRWSNSSAKPYLERVARLAAHLSLRQPTPAGAIHGAQALPST